MKLFSLEIRTIALALLVTFSGSFMSVAYGAGKRAAKLERKNNRKANAQQKEARANKRKNKRNQNTSNEEAAPAAEKRGGRKNKPKPADDTTQTDNHAKQAQQLFKKFVNVKKNTMSWTCFSQKLSAALSNEPKYKPLVTDLKALGAEKNALKIGTRLLLHKNLLTTETKTLINQYTTQQILDILKQRIALNGKDQC
jgi:hypothetical protein